MIKYVGEKFSVDVLKEYKESSPYIDMKSGTWWRFKDSLHGLTKYPQAISLATQQFEMEFYGKGSTLWLVTTMSLSMI
jgi:hypothetical protein